MAADPHADSIDQTAASGSEAAGGARDRRSFYRTFGAGCVTGVAAAVLGALLFVVFGALFLQDWTVAKRAEQLEPPPIAARRPANFDWPLLAMDGERFHLSEAKGDVILLVLWRPNCVPCLAEIPSLNQLYTELKSDDVRIISVSFGTLADTQSIAKQYAVFYPVYVSEQPPPDMYATGKTPTALIIDRDGSVAFEHIGAAKWDAPSVVAYLDLLAREAE